MTSIKINTDQNKHVSFSFGKGHCKAVSSALEASDILKKHTKTGAVKNYGDLSLNVNTEPRPAMVLPQFMVQLSEA